jgi:hypothetical protein
MAAPDYVPVKPEDRPRRAEQLPPADKWVARPGDFWHDRPGQPEGPALGNPGPDLGYVLTLVPRFADRVKLQTGEDHEDVDAGCVAVAMKRAATFGRAPVIYDLEHAYTLFGFLDESPPADILAWRKERFEGAAHHYETQRAIAAAVPEPTLRLAPAQVRERLREWRGLLDG